MLTITPEILREIKNFNRNVDWLKKKEAKVSKAWGTAYDVIKMTGWNAIQLKKARERGLVEFKKKGKSISYDLSTINKQFLKS